MDDTERKCPSCGTVLSASEAQAEQCPRCGAALQQPAAGALETAPRDSAFGLRVSLWGNGLTRFCLRPYAAVRGWSERYGLPVRLLACLLPFCVGALVSFSIWTLLPGAAYGWALGVLGATLVVGLPTAVVFFPGSTAAAARQALERLRREAQELRDERVRALVWQARQRMLAAREMQEAEEMLKAEAAAPPLDLVPVRREEARAPGFGLARVLAAVFQLIGWGQLVLAGVFLAVGVFAGAAGLLALPLILGLVWSGLLVLAVGLLLKHSAQTRRDLWRTTRALEQIRESLAAAGERGEAQ